MFVDKVTVKVKAGDGGPGIVSFRREKFVDRGGPDGGDGGHGGSVIFAANRNHNTLSAFRHQKLLKANDGESGGKRKRHGASAEDLRVEVPVGTMIFDEKGSQIADFVNEGQQAIVAQGGKGGFGNAHFTTSTRQAPRISEKGEPGDNALLVLELKMIADVGLVGLPNAGKSTLLATISNAKPEIADYPFTTLTPNLGVVDIDENTTVLFADIPGLIEGAAQGKGLGDDFLRHVERTKLLVHLIDAYQDDVAAAYKTVLGELAAYKSDLSKRTQLVALNKIDGLDEEIVAAKLAELKKVLPAKTQLTAISAKSGTNVQATLFEVKKLLQKIKNRKPKSKSEELPILRLSSDDDKWRVVKEKDGYAIVGKKIEKFALKTDFTNPQGVQRLRNIMRKMGIMHELERKGAKAEDLVKIGTHKLFY